MSTIQKINAVLLNLDRDTARLSHMEKQLAQAGIAFIRQAGFLGNEIPEDLKPYFFNPDGSAKTTMRQGEIGCYASHLRALMRVAAGQLGPVVLIMEDDLAIDPDSIAIITAALQKAPQGWDIIRLSNPPRRAYVPLAACGTKHFLVRYSKIPTSAGAYLITPAGAKKFIENGIRGLSFDDDLRRPWFHHMDSYGILPPPLWAGVTQQSSIDSVEAGRFDKPVTSRIERILRGDYFYVFKRVAYNISNLGITNWLACAAINLGDMLAKPIVGHSIIDDAARLFPVARNK